VWQQQKNPHHHTPRHQRRSETPIQAKGRSRPEKKGAFQTRLFSASP
jgi:hypothetical protein